MRFASILTVLAFLALAGCTELPTGPDTTAPTITLVSPGSGTTATDSLVVVVTASDNRGVARTELYIGANPEPVTVDSTSPYRLTAYLADIGSGANTYYAAAVDSAGNRTSTAPNDFTAVLTPGLKYISRLVVDGSARDVVVIGDRAYVATMDGGVIVMDVSNHMLPIFLSRYITAGPVKGLAATADRLFVADGTQGVLSLSLANPDSLTELAQLVPSGIDAWDLVVSGDYAYVAGGTAGLYALNIANPDTLIVAGWLTLGNDVRDVEVAGGYAYTAEMDGGFKVIDIAKPDSMKMTDQYLVSLAQDVSLSGSIAYVAAGNNGLYAVDVTVPDNILVADVYNSGNTIQGVVATATYTYLGSGAAGVEIIDSSNPSALVSVTNGIFDTDGNSYKLALNGGYIFVADHTSLTILKYIAP